MDTVDMLWETGDQGSIHYYISRNVTSHDQINHVTTDPIPSDTTSWVDILHYVVNVYMNSILCAFGLVGNILIIYVLCKDKTHNSNNCLLQSLAIYDILLLLFTIVYTILRSVYPATGALQNYYELSPYIIALGLPIGWVAQTGTIWFTTLVAADRYLAISYPFKAIRWCTHTHAIKASLVTSLMAVIFNLPRFFHYYLVAKNTADVNQTFTFISHVKIDMDGWNTEIYHYLYHVGLTFVFLYIIPLTALILFNSRLIRALNNARRTQRRLSCMNTGAYRQNMSITLNMVVVISKFILCETPDFIAAIIGAMPIATESGAYRVFLIIKEMLLVFNSSVNFYIYLVFNSKFRNILTTNWGCCRCCCHSCDESHDQIAMATSDITVHTKSKTKTSEGNNVWLPSMAMHCGKSGGHVNPVMEDDDSGIFGSREINITPDCERKYT